MRFARKICIVILLIVCLITVDTSASIVRKGKGGYNNFNYKGPEVEKTSKSEPDVLGLKDDEIDILHYSETLDYKLRNAKFFDIVTFGHYEQDGNYENGKEPIEWRVISTEDGRAFLTSRYILDCQKFNSIAMNVTWEKCTLRQWLNNDFIEEAFDPEECTRILETYNLNKKNHYYNTDSGNPTYDKAFLLSLEEAILYFGEGEDYYTKQQTALQPNAYRKCEGTEYAIRRGLRVSKEGFSKGCGNYWLRTAGDNREREWYDGIFAKYYAAIVQEPGYVKPMGTAVQSSDDGVRPCIWISYQE